MHCKRTAALHRNYLTHPRRGSDPLATNPKPRPGGTRNLERRTMKHQKLYNALALLTDCAQRLLAEISDPIALKENLHFLDHALKNAEKILIEYPATK